MRYFYARVSSREQNLDRQLEAAKAYKDSIDRVFCDKQSGKDFEREQYKEMKRVVQHGDEVIIKELDRLGRNKDLIKDEIRWFKDNGVTLRILEMASTLIDYQGQAWIGEMVNNLLIEVLGTMAEQERIKSKQRQREGIDAMQTVDGKKVSRKTGNSYGRPKREIADFKNFLQQKKDGIITIQKGCEILGISRSLWYQLEKESGLSSLPRKS
jgi:DNA invertase Pin-like site-specific DNA recombinase